MFKRLLYSFIIILAILVPIYFQADNITNLKISNSEENISGEKESPEERMETTEDRAQYEFDMLKDPKTGKIPKNIRAREIAFAEKLPVQNSKVSNTYSVLGPTNLGGRTRAFVYDKTDATIMLSGGVSSGVFRSSNSGANWTKVSPSNEFHNVTTIAQDPRSGFTSTWYYGTGEAIGNSTSLGAFYLGNGIYKSTNNGLNWTVLPATVSTLENFDSQFDIIDKIAVDSSTGNVYCACQNEISRSTDGGTSWLTVLGTLGGNTSTGVTDVVCARNGRIYASFSGTEGSGNDGVWTSATGASGTWTKIAGSGSGSTPAGWNAANAYGRVVLTLAPSNNDVLYVLYYNNTTSSCAGTAAPEADFFKWTQSTTTWVDRSANLPDESGCLNGNDPFAAQGGYDLVVTVKPDDENFVVIGGTNSYRSTNGFATTSATTRIGGYVSSASYGLYTNSHPDVHCFAFHPATSTIMVCGNDGGIQRTSDITSGTVAWTSISNEYVTYQYYHVALDPTSGSSIAIGGAQDNGTTYNAAGTSTHASIFGGDGVSVGISAGNVNHYVGSQNGNIYRRLSGDPSGSGTDIKPSGSGTGVFVTKFYLDPDNTADLYFADGSSLYRTTSASTVANGTWTQMTGVGTTISGAGAGSIFAFATTRGTYSASSKLYLGTTGGKVFRLNDPASASAGTNPVNITSGLTGSGTISGIAVDPSDDKKVMVVYSNYGVVSIWYTADASVASPTWVNEEGNLTLPSIRSCAIVNRLSSATEYYVGTSVGLYGTTSLAGAGTVWALEGATTVKFSVVSSMVVRPVDNGLLIGTHGNGMFYTTVPGPLPVELSSFTSSISKRDVTLKWTTLHEINNSGFDIERKMKNGNWLKAGFVIGNGTTNVPQTYRFDDRDLSADVYSYRLKQIDYNGNYHYFDLANEVIIGVPEKFELSQNYPNPFNPTTKINYSLPFDSRVSLKIYDIAGKEITQIVNETQSAGYYTVQFNASDLSSGIYFYVITASSDKQNFIKTLKMLLVK